VRRTCTCNFNRLPARVAHRINLVLRQKCVAPEQLPIVYIYFIMKSRALHVDMIPDQLAEISSLRPVFAAIGFIAVVGGYHVYRLLVGCVAFILGSIIVLQANPNTGIWELLMYAVGGGLIGFFSHFLFDKLPALIAVFFAGIYISQMLPPYLGFDSALVSMPIPLLIGLICALSLLLTFALPTMLISSIGGSLLLLENMYFGNLNRLALLVIFALVGFIAQFILYQYLLPVED